MLSYLTLGLSLVVLAAIWPPFNVYIANALIKDDKKTVLLIVAAAVAGLALSSAMVAGGASLTKLPLGKLGGAFVVWTGIRPFLKTGSAWDEEKAQNRVAKEAIAASFLVSATPGVYAFSVAQGILRQDVLHAGVVFLSGPIGILAGGTLLARGLRLLSLPIEKIGGAIVIFIGLRMILS